MASGLPYLILSLISKSARPKIPSPICLQSYTDSLCSFNGWSGSPSSNTSFNAITDDLTQCLKLSKSNPVSHANSARLILPNKHDPPAGRGSSYIIIVKAFYLLLLEISLIPIKRKQSVWNTSVNSDQSSIHFLWG